VGWLDRDEKNEGEEKEKKKKGRKIQPLLPHPSPLHTTEPPLSHH